MHFRFGLEANCMGFLGVRSLIFDKFEVLVLICGFSSHASPDAVSDGFAHVLEFVQLS